jgi:hypothetical protein
MRFSRTSNAGLLTVDIKGPLSTPPNVRDGIITSQFAVFGPTIDIIIIVQADDV